MSKEGQHDRVKLFLKRPLRPCALDESSLSIGRVQPVFDNPCST